MGADSAAGELSTLLGPEPLRHFMAFLAVPCGLLAVLRFVDVKDKLAGVAADQHHIVILDLPLA